MNALQSHYDDIVVGAGSAGAVVATRLSEDPARRVLLLEAGPYFPSVETLPPALRDANEPALRGFNWPLRVRLRDGANQASSRGAGAAFDYAVGRVVGGSSSVNGAVALRGLPEDYEAWAATSSPAWGWERVLHDFCVLESDRDRRAGYHGQTGLIPIERDREGALTSIQAAFQTACAKLGEPSTDDLNAPDGLGTGILPRNERDGVRMSTALSHLAVARTRTNLTIAPATQVSRLDGLGGASQMCSGVEAMHAGRSLRIAADRVVLSAGVIHTPAILQRSGIGDPDHLRSLGIDVCVAAPAVGANLHDHPVVILWAVPKPGAVELGERSHQVALRCNSSLGRRGDLNLYMLGAMRTQTFAMLEQALRAPIAVGVSVTAMAPESRGRVRLRSADAAAEPEVTMNCVAEQRDRRTLRDGIEIAWECLQQAELRSQLERIFFWTPGLVGSAAAIDHAITTFARPSWHGAGTARMGRAGDSGAVVDSTGRVFGLDNVWVADASIMPVIPRAPTHLSCAMIGEHIGTQLRSL